MANWIPVLRALSMFPQFGREALTVTFLLASHRESLEPTRVSREEARRELEAIIGSFVDDVPQELVVTLYRCGLIGQPVAKMISQSLNHYPSRHCIESKVQNRRTLFVDSEFDTTAGSLTVSSLTDKLLQELSGHICEARFSFDGGEYRELSKEERKFIEECTLP